MNQQYKPKLPIGLSYINTFVNSKGVQHQKEKTFDPGVGGGIDLPIYVIVGFQIRILRVFINHLLKMLNVLLELKRSWSWLNLSYAEDKYSRGKSQTASCFKHLTEHDIRQP